MGRRAASALALLLALGGCGYRFTAGPALLPSGMRAVYVPEFGNLTAEPGLDALFTEACRAELARRGALGGTEAPGRLEGEVRALSGGPTILDARGQLASYRLSAVAHFRLIRDGATLAETDVSGQEEYLPDRTDGDVLRTETRRQEALRRLAEAMARDAWDRLAVGE